MCFPQRRQYLGLPQLAALALEEYRRQLNWDIVEQESTSELYMQHAPVRKMVMHWIGTNYKAGVSRGLHRKCQANSTLFQVVPGH